MTLDPRLPTPGPPVFAILTPTGRGALATVGVRGKRAVEIVGRRFTTASGKPLTAFSLGRVIFGRFRTTAAVEEELVVGLVAADEIEIHCHGGVAAEEAICEALAAEGCVRLSQEQWSEATEPDPLAAAALVALAQARTERTAAILLDQYRGALRVELKAIQDDLARGDVAAADQRLTALLSRGELGLHLTQPWHIVLAGLPNAGKSSLLNAILGYERAIVFPQPGTTRDILTATTAIDGWPVELADTAGLREPGDPLEAEGVSRARREVAAADLVLLVADATVPWDSGLFGELRVLACQVLVVHNKLDLAPPAGDRTHGPSVSAITGQGIDQLCRAIASRLVPQPPPPRSAVPFSPEQLATLAAARQHLDHRDAGAALSAISQLLSG